MRMRNPSKIYKELIKKQNRADKSTYKQNNFTSCHETKKKYHLEPLHFSWGKKSSAKDTKCLASCLAKWSIFD